MRGKLVFDCGEGECYGGELRIMSQDDWVRIGSFYWRGVVRVRWDGRAKRESPFSWRWKWEERLNNVVEEF